MENMKTTTIATNGINLHVAMAGDEAAPLVLLLHGFPDFWYVWRKQIETLAEHYWVVAPDQRGYNFSTKTPGVASYQLGHLTADIAGLIHALGREHAHVVGHDWGGIVAWQLAMTLPAMVTKLAVLNAPHPGVFKRFIVRSADQRKRSRYMAFFQLPWLPEKVLAASDFKMMRESMQKELAVASLSEKELDRYKIAWQQPGALTGMLNWYRASARHPTSKPANDVVEQPALIIWGRKDRFLSPELATLSLEKCPNGKLAFIDDAGHWVQIDQGQQVTHLIDRFLRGVIPSP